MKTPEEILNITINFLLDTMNNEKLDIDIRMDAANELVSILKDFKDKEISMVGC